MYVVHLSSTKRALGFGEEEHSAKQPEAMLMLTWVRVAPAMPRMMMFHIICSHTGFPQPTEHALCLHVPLVKSSPRRSASQGWLSESRQPYREATTVFDNVLSIARTAGLGTGVCCGDFLASASSTNLSGGSDFKWRSIWRNSESYSLGH